MTNTDKLIEDVKELMRENLNQYERLSNLLTALYEIKLTRSNLEPVPVNEEVALAGLYESFAKAPVTDATEVN